MGTKFDGEKVINRSQSGSFEHRCMGADLRMNLGPNWGPTTRESLKGSQPSNSFSQAAEVNSKMVTNDRKRKSTDSEKANRRKRKYAKTSDDSLAAHQAYSRHDNGEQPHVAALHYHVWSMLDELQVSHLMFWHISFFSGLPFHYLLTCASCHLSPFYCSPLLPD